MNDSRTFLSRSVTAAILLGVLSIVALLASVLALADIGHGEPDLTLEWRVLRIAIVTVFVFHAVALGTLARVRVHLRGAGNDGRGF